MRLTTMIWAKMENKGSPADTVTLNATTHEVIKELAAWLMATTMNSRIQITVARREADLTSTKRVEGGDDLAAELDAILAGVGGTPEQADVDNYRETLCAATCCLGLVQHIQGSTNCRVGRAEPNQSLRVIEATLPLTRLDKCKHDQLLGLCELCGIESKKVA